MFQDNLHTSHSDIIPEVKVPLDVATAHGRSHKAAAYALSYEHVLRNEVPFIVVCAQCFCTLQRRASTISANFIAITKECTVETILNVNLGSVSKPESYLRNEKRLSSKKEIK